MCVFKIVELVGSSEVSWQDAVDNAIKRASKIVRNIRGVDVLGWTGKVKDGKISSTELT